VKVFLDTNVLASALATRGLCAELFEAVLQSHELLVSPPVLKELERVLPAKLGQSRQITTDFIELLQVYATIVKGANPAVSLPDPDDEPIVASALAGKAQVFVTGDKALLELGSVEDLPIVSPRQFWEMLIVPLT
jgi:putative PIN family toxin of toxin-antitoxin system